MGEEEARKAIRDGGTQRDKIEKYKVEIYQLKKSLKEKEKYQALYEEIRERDQER